MAKGRTNQPLRILVLGDELFEHPELVKLSEQGHTVTCAAPEHDLVIGPRAWRMTPELMKYLPLALKSARAVKREKKAKEGKG